jgi:hypothetical protein
MTMLRAIRKAMQEDPIGGSALIDEIVYSYLSDQAEELRPEIEQMQSNFMSERINIAKRSLGRSYVESVVEGNYPEENIKKSAQWIADIEHFVSVSKDELTGSALYEFNRKHPRGIGGRFREGLGVKELNPKHPTTTRAMEKISPNLRDKSVRRVDGVIEINGDSDIDAAVINREQHQYELANRVVNGMLNNFSGKSLEGINVIVNLTSGTDNKKFSIPYDAKTLRNHSGFDLPDDKLWNVGDTIDDFEIQPKRDAKPVVRNQVAAYNTLGSTNNNLAAFAAVNPESYRNLAASYNYSNSQKRGKLDNFFGRLSAGGDVFSQVPGMEKYGAYARFVGELGPQAEDALGPYAQRAAYRYRGTEKEPDLDLVRQFNSRMMRSVDAAGESRTKMSDISDAIMSASMDRANQGDIVLQAASHQINNLSRTRGGQFTPDELALNVRADVAAHHLLSTLPDDPFVARVSAESGNILPSQGVIIDADGDVISQSVGFSDDHYLPFDLKNLKSLYGGQYVRTRQQGGLTGEDIYTAIRTGTRMATVVSSSGVYSIEFDPNFRGARANSDKARSMYDRYLKILDAIEREKLYVKDIDGAEKAQLRAQANAMGDTDGTIYTRFLEERRQASKTLDEGTLAILQEESIAQADSEGFKVKGDRYSRRVEEIFDEKSEEKLKERVSELSLNAKGYDVALRTLQQQFPYFIRNVSYQPLTSKQQGEGFLQNLNQSGKLGARQSLGSKDQGYVNPGGLRPEKTRQGFYNPSTQSYNRFKNEKFYGSIGADEVISDEEAKEPKTGAGAAPKGPSKSAFLSQVDLFSAGKKDAGARAAKDLDMIFQNVPTSEMTIGKAPNDPSGLNVSFEDAINNSDRTTGREIALKILLHVQGGGIYNQFEKSPAEVASLLSDKKLVDKVFNGMYGSNYDIIGFPEGMSADDFKKKIVEAGAQMATAASFQEPFAAASAGDNSEFYTGSKPQAFDELSMVSDPASITRLLQSNRPLANAFNEMSAFSSDAEAADVIADYIKILTNAQKTSAQALASKSPDYSLETVLNAAGIKPDAWAKAIGNPEDLRRAGYSSGREMTIFDSNVISERARNLQKGRSLAQAQRLMAEMSGGATPKATPPSGELAKSLQASSSRQVQVVSKSHPLSLEIQRRRSLNLPLVSKK